MVTSYMQLLRQRYKEKLDSMMHRGIHWFDWTARTDAAADSSDLLTLFASWDEGQGARSL